MENLVLIKNEKKLEPTSSQCGFCAEGIVSDLKNCHYAPVYKVADRTNLAVYRSVKFKQLEVGIPRCHSCAEIHKQGASKAHKYLGICGLFIALIAFSSFGIIGAVFLTLFGIGVTDSFISKRIQNSFASKNDVFSLEEGVQANESIQELIDLEWSLTKPEA
jgi:hypothetical protein